MARDPKQVIKNAQRVSKHATSDDPKGQDGIFTYTPYDTSGQSQERLHIRRSDDTMHYPSYRYLMDIIHTISGNGIVLVYSFMMVKITGQNLDELIDHIAQGNATFIEEFDVRKWPRPQKGAAIIEKIEVVARSDSDTLNLDKEKKVSPSLNESEDHYP